MVRLQVRAIPTTKHNCISTTDDTDDSDTVQTTSRPSPINNIASTYWTSSEQSTTDSYIQRERTTHSWHPPTITISKGTASITYAAYSQAGWSGTFTYIVEFRYSNCHSIAATTTDAAAATTTHSTSSRTYCTRYSGTTRPTLHY